MTYSWVIVYAIYLTTINHYMLRNIAQPVFSSFL